MDHTTALNQIGKATVLSLTAGKPNSIITDTNDMQLMIAGKRNHPRVTVTLESDDTYTVTAGKIRTKDYIPAYVEVYRAENIYHDQLEQAVMDASMAL